jgi:hypothetical protein
VIVAVTCTECVKKYTTNVPKKAMERYQDGTPPELAFALLSANARNLIVDKMCPTCWAKVIAE